MGAESNLSSWTRWGEGYADPRSDNLILSELQLFHKDGMIIAAFLNESTPSGDWIKQTEYYFRGSGNTAFIFSVLNTFLGNVSVETGLYFDLDSVQIREEKQVFDLKSKKRLDEKTAAYMENPPEVRLSVEAFDPILREADGFVGRKLNELNAGSGFMTSRADICSQRTVRTRLS